MKNETIPTGTVKMRYIEAFNKATGLKVEIAFWLKEKADALESGDVIRIDDAVIELRELDKQLAYAELDMMYYADILKMRNEIL